MFYHLHKYHFIKFLQIQVGRLQLTLQVRTKCEVYLCYEDGHGWNSDQLQRIGFVKKSEKVEDSDGDKMMIHHKNCLGKETVTLPETTGKGALVTIFVK